LTEIQQPCLLPSWDRGLAFSAPPVFIYRETITRLASSAKGFLSSSAVMEKSTAGGILILGIGINILKIGEIKGGSFCRPYFSLFHWRTGFLKIFQGNIFKQTVLLSCHK
jgi:hypothetical protein